MKYLLLFLATSILCLNGVQAIAGCDVTYTRTACPGKETTSYKKCNGQPSCTKSSTAETVEACRVKAVAACANDRLDITKSKVVTATFDGKPVPNKAGGADHCLDYAQRAAEFNKCGP